MSYYGTKKYNDALLKTPVMNAVTLAATRTAVIGTAGYNQLTLFFNHTFNAATDIKMTVEVSPDGTNYYHTQTIDLETPPTSASATATLASGRSTWVRATGSANGKWTWNVKLNNYPYTQITITNTAGGANDLLTVYALLGSV